MAFLVDSDFQADLPFLFIYHTHSLLAPLAYISAALLLPGYSLLGITIPVACMKTGKGHHFNKRHIGLFLTHRTFPSLIGTGFLLGAHFLLVEIQVGVPDNV